MNYRGLGLASVSLLLVIAANRCLAKEKHAPLPAKVLSAKSVYIENHGVARVADQAYEELTKWGRWEIVQDRVKADLVLVLSAEKAQSTTGQTQTYDPNAKTGTMTTGGWKYGTTTSTAPGSVHLEIVESKTGETLYADTERATRGTITELRKRIEEQEKVSSAK